MSIVWTTDKITDWKIKWKLITAPFIIICVLVAIAFFVGMKVGEDNIKVKHRRDKLQDWRPHE